MTNEIKTIQDFLNAYEAEQKGVGITPETEEQLKQIKAKIDSMTEALQPQLENVGKAAALQMQRVQESLQKFTDAIKQSKQDHPGAWELIEDKEKREAFIQTITGKDIKACFLINGIDEDEKQLIKHFADTFDNGTAEEKTEAFNLFAPGMLIDLYEYKQTHTAYRTKAKAGDVISDLPHDIATLTFSGYQYATSLYQSGNAYLQPLTSTDGLIFKDGRIYFKEETIRKVSEVELQDMKTKEGIEEIDLPLLRTFYSIILTAFERTGCKEIKPVITLFIPELAEALGLKQKNLNKADIANIILKTQKFHNIVGVLHTKSPRGLPAESYYPVLNFEGYDTEKNKISFSSPYMNMVIQKVYNIAVRKDAKGKPKLKKSGEPLRLPTHSYLVKSEINKERNKAAVENVFIICTLIEQAGDNVPRIKASTIIERNPALQQRLETVKRPSRILSECFKKTWELLKTETHLQENYKNIILPDPDDPANIPTISNYKTLVFSFPHDGKQK